MHLAAKLIKSPIPANYIVGLMIVRPIPTMLATNVRIISLRLLIVLLRRAPAITPIMPPM